MKVSLLYNVPVYVVVDTETLTVDSVSVNCEGVSIGGDGDPWNDDGCGVTGPEGPAAVEIAETAEWPAWEF